MYKAMFVFSKGAGRDDTEGRLFIVSDIHS